MKTIILHIIMLLAFFNGHAQTPTTSHEIGITGGDSYYLGELNQTHFIPFSLAGGLFYRYNYDDRIAVVTSFHYLPIKGNDASSTGSFQGVRNQNFSSTLYELSVVAEINFLNFTHLDEKSSPYTPYAFLGFGYFYHDPKTQSEGVNYKKYQASIPLGVGLKYRVNKVTFGFEWGIRKTYTDYLDDVSGFFRTQPVTSKDGSSSNLNNYQRGNMYNKDWFIYSGISLSINLTSKVMCRDRT
ncbi:MAG: hypothetical protein ACJA0Q_001386 [Saprospiraceae bacterium]